MLWLMGSASLMGAEDPKTLEIGALHLIFPFLVSMEKPIPLTVSKLANYC